LSLTGKQIHKELSDLACEFPTLWFAGPVNNGMLHWQTTIMKSNDHPRESGRFFWQFIFLQTTLSKP
uniref:UBC core domain-containing protein n=1 Tax=Rhinolophus ferrumequinum TaxID=59479 RepID=A0A671G245_RHIFE